MATNIESKVEDIFKNSADTVKEAYEKIKRDPGGIFAINIYLGIIIVFVLFYFYYYLTWDLGDKKKITCTNTINNIKRFGDGWANYIISEPRLVSEYNDYGFWTICSETKTPTGLKVDLETKVGNDHICKKISLKDHFFMGCFNSSGCGDEWQSYVDNRDKPTGGTVLENVLGIGVRAVDFELFLKDNDEKKKILVVAIGIPAENNKYYLKGSYNQIPFSKILATLTAYVDNTVNTAFQKHPLLVNLRIRSNNPIIYDKLKMDLDDFVDGGMTGKIPDEKYSLKNFGVSGSVYENIIDAPIEAINGKIIFILNDNPLNSTGNYIKNSDKDKDFLKYIYITDSQHENMANAVVMDSNSIINTHNKEETIEDFKGRLGIALPDWSTVIKNPDFIKHMSMGCQISLMKFSLNDINLKEYFKYWKNQGGTVHVKGRDGDIYWSPDGQIEQFRNIEGMTIVHEKKIKPMTTKQETNVNPDSQIDEAKSRKRSGLAFAEAARQFSEGD